MIVIPTDSTGELREYTQQVALEGTKYLLKLSWNTRTEMWMLSLYNTDLTAIIEGAGVTCGVDLLRGSAQPKPPGRLFAGPTDESTVRPGLDGLGSRVRLYYVESDEL